MHCFSNKNKLLQILINLLKKQDFFLSLYKKAMNNFAGKGLRKYPFVKVDTNGMSTQVFGDYKQVMNAINSEMESTFLNENSVVFTLKVINSDLEEKPSF